MRNHEVTEKQQLLNSEGRIQEPGWARRPVWKYDRSMIRSPKFRIKEWDYYLVMNEKYGADIRLLQAPLVEISSTTIRRRAEKGLSIRYMVPDVVSEYIQSNALYKIKSE